MKINDHSKKSTVESELRKSIARSLQSSLFCADNVEELDIYDNDIILYFRDGHSFSIDLTMLSDPSEPWQDA